MNLISIYERLDRHELLYQLLAERGDEVNISHQKMPSWDEHVDFIESHPYEAWYFICNPDPVGACYLTHNDEIGVFVFGEYQKQGYAREAVKTLMEMHGPRRYLANMNPRNVSSRFLFSGLGFRMVQHTYELVA